MNRKILTIVGIALLLVISTGGLLYLRQKSIVNSFETCAAKYPVQESYPQVCRTPDGKSFTDPVGQKCATEQELSATCAKIDNVYEQ